MVEVRSHCRSLFERHQTATRQPRRCWCWFRQGSYLRDSRTSGGQEGSTRCGNETQTSNLYGNPETLWKSKPQDYSAPFAKWLQHPDVAPPSLRFSHCPKQPTDIYQRPFSTCFFFQPVAVPFSESQPDPFDDLEFPGVDDHASG